MRHFIKSGVIGIILTLSSMAAEKTGDQPDITLDGIQISNQTEEFITIIPEGPNNPLLADTDFDSSDGLEAQQSSIMSQCLAQFVGKTRLFNQFSVEGESFKFQIFIKGGITFAGICLTVVGGASMTGSHPLPYNECIGMIIPGAVLLIPLANSILSEVVYQGAKYLGKENFIEQADDAGNVPLFMSDWRGHFTQGSLGAKNCLSWFFTPCCGPTTLALDDSAES